MLLQVLKKDRCSFRSQKPKNYVSRKRINLKYRDGVAAIGY